MKNISLYIKVIILLFLIQLLFSCRKNDMPKPIIHKDLLRMDSADAKEDFKNAIDKKDYRFIGIYGYSVEILGIENKYYWYVKDSIGLKMIEGTSDAITSKEQEILQNMAIKYAKEYNELLYKYLRDRNSFPRME